MGSHLSSPFSCFDNHVALIVCYFFSLFCLLFTFLSSGFLLFSLIHMNSCSKNPYALISINVVCFSSFPIKWQEMKQHTCTVVYACINLFPLSHFQGLHFSYLSKPKLGTRNPQFLFFKMGRKIYVANKYEKCLASPWWKVGKLKQLWHYVFHPPNWQKN